MANEFKVRKALEVTGPATISGNATIGGSETIAGTLVVTGQSTFSGGIGGNPNFTGNVSIAQDLVVTGDLTVTGSFSFAGGSVFPDDTFAVQGNIDDTKQVMFSLGGATTGTTTTITVSQTSNQNIALPDASTTLVGHDTSQTLTNKAINASNNTITNLADANIAAAAAIAVNKLAAVTANRAMASDASGFLVVSSVTDTELGQLSGVLSQVDGISDTRTLTNKTISAGSNTITGLGDANIDSAAAIARSKLANGTAGHVLINNGGGVMSSEAQLSALRGGTGADLSASTGVVHFTAGVASTQAQLDETRGGTNQSTFATGDILYASASNTLSKRAIGTVGQLLKVNSSGIPAWEDRSNPAAEVILFDDWITDGTGMLRWLGTVVGAGATNTTTGSTAVNDANHPGVLELATGTTATGQSARYLGGVATGNATAGFLVGGGAMSQEWLVRIEDLSTAGERFNFDMGFYGAETLAADAIRFRYSDNLNSGNWTAETISAAAATTATDSGVAVAADTWYKLRIDINAAGTSVTFYVNGVLVATHTTDITAVLIAPRARMIKSVGTTSRSGYVDYFKFYQRLTATR